MLVRHAEFARRRDAEGRLEEALTETGRRQAEAVARRLEGLGTPLVIYSSPQARALETARVLGDATAHSVFVDAELAELRLRLPADEAEVRSAELWARARADVETPPEAEAESLRAVQRRALHALRGAVAANRGAVVVAVTHGGVIEALWCHFEGVPLARVAERRTEIPHGAVFEWRVRLAGEGEDARLLAANATDHLAP